VNGALDLASPVATGTPDRGRSRQRYQAAAPAYDAVTAAGDSYRLRTVRRLAPQPGEVILEIGCGTGLNFPLLLEPIGPDGMLVGVDLSPDMLARARRRVREHGWRNVSLIEGPAEDVEIPVLADAVLFCGTHDVLRSPAAIANVLRFVGPGGRVVAGGPKWAPWWWPGSLALNVYTWQLNRGFVTTFEGFSEPWTYLADAVAELEVEEVFFGGGYIAEGRV